MSILHGLRMDDTFPGRRTPAVSVSSRSGIASLQTNLAWKLAAAAGLFEILAQMPS